jgi:DNA-binding response OmpR family regulator
MNNNRKVLIIEDNQDMQEIYKLWLEEAGFDVKISRDGLMGITDIVDYMPDLVILDIMMPEMSGYDFLRALKENTSINVPVIVASNLAQEGDKEKALAAGADMYLVKSDWEVPDVVAKICEFLNNRQESKS